MEYILVMIICFGADCQAIFDVTRYVDYESCFEVAIQTTQLMQQTYPQSAGEIHCFNEQQFSEFQKFLQQGGEPTIDPSLLGPELPTA